MLSGRKQEEMLVLTAFLLQNKKLKIFEKFA